MTSVDTNLLVRFFTRDDEKQYQRAYAVFSTEKIFVSDTVLLETEWVLRFAYEFPTNRIADGFSALFGLPTVFCSSPVILRNTLDWYRRGLDFADALHLALSQSCARLKTFDKDFVKKSKGLSACEVSIP